MTLPDQRNHRFLGLRPENRLGRAGSQGSFIAVSKAINDPKKNPARKELDHRPIARLRLSLERKRGPPPIKHHWTYSFHFFTVTVVPFPCSETISKSSINLRTPGKPSPKLPEVENPSRIASRLSLILAQSP